MTRVPTWLRAAWVRAAVATLALGAMAGCKSTTPPTAFGVNLTIDAKALSATDRMNVTSGKLSVTGAETVSKTMDVHAAIQGGVIRFHYFPGAGVVSGSSLSFAFEAIDAANKVVSTGTGGPITLAANAVDLTITLPAGGNGKGNGTACGTGPECSSGFCADGVCCNEKCDDVCVSCNQSASKGTCTAYAKDTDPELECAAKLPPPVVTEDAGAGAPDAADAADAAAAEGGDVSPAADAAAPLPPPDSGSDASASDAAVINTPDGGLMTMPKSCGGACGGARACAFPGKATSCGKAFCNTDKDVASFVCDGNGGCAVELASCTAYACDESKGACRTQCSSHSDCQAGLYCNGNNLCVLKKDNSLTCATDAECKHNHCSTGVCCNTQCDAPFTCNSSGSVGQCKCPGVTCAAGVACQVFYQDADSDGYGNRAGSILAATAQAGCAGTPPAGFVADNTDCDDKDANAHPGQTTYFGDLSKGGLYDYNCDGKTEKETPEYPNGSCKFCGVVGSCDQTSTVCASANQTASFICPQEYLELTRAVSVLPLAGLVSYEAALSVAPPEAAAAAAPSAITPAATIPGPICSLCLRQCCGCHAADKTGFTKAGGVNCGAYDYTSTCGACAAAGGAAAVPTKTYKRQLCR